MARTSKNTSGPTFEQGLQRLEEIMDLLERGDVPLEDSLKMYEEGVRLSKECMKKLNEAELRIKRLTGKELEDFDVSEANGDL